MLDLGLLRLADKRLVPANQIYGKVIMRYGEKTYQEGQKQLAIYTDKQGCSEGWLIVFDRRKRAS